ncbi:hypothetical protein KSX_71730 [Ktedonospora formicarum]|uniref:Uncharacterized protein n=1 Tax=Ktedonospora formicarum TaxID=2778364 RepID=A0A8J3MXV7_9CHLR|nr:hypothetical protein KSX_71730 [Ktedonospora formicarum]
MLQRTSRCHRRKTKGSQSPESAQCLSRMHARIANVRQDTLHARDRSDRGENPRPIKSDRV